MKSKLKSKRWCRRNRRNKELMLLLNLQSSKSFYDQYVVYSPSYKRLAVKTIGQPQAYLFFSHGWGKPIEGDEFKRYANP
jgi:hypothetical protein